MPLKFGWSWIILSSTHIPSFIHKSWQGSELQYDRWGSCSIMLLTIIASHSNTISSLTCFLCSLPRDTRPLQITLTLCSPRFLLNSTMTLRNKALRRVQGKAATRESEMSICVVHSLNACFVRLCAFKQKCCAEYSVSECNSVLRKSSEWYVSRHVGNVLLTWYNEKMFMKKR